MLNSLLILINSYKCFCYFIFNFDRSKVSDKIQVINNLLDKVDSLIVAGGMAFTFLKIIHKMQVSKSRTI